jgi:hypothetical protein
VVAGGRLWTGRNARFSSGEAFCGDASSAEACQMIEASSQIMGVALLQAFARGADNLSD